MEDAVRSNAYDYDILQTPSPKRKPFAATSPQTPPTFSDRLIPSRAATNFAFGFDHLEVKENARPGNSGSTGTNSSSISARASAAQGTENDAVDMYDQLLKTELLGKQSPQTGEQFRVASPESTNLFQYKCKFDEVPPWPLRVNEDNAPRNAKAQHRTIRKTPVRVMDAPDMQDDFYLNLLDWSVGDELAVALGNKVYTWNATNNRVSLLCDLHCDSVTSVKWACKSHQHIAVGSSNGQVQIWDKEHGKKIRTMAGHRRTVCSLAWHGYDGGYVLSSGGRDGMIYHRDVRQRDHFFSKVNAHSQVCGLQWSPNDMQLASGSEDNKVRIWSLQSQMPLLQCCKHQSAVKALAWSPHQAGLLASGGGVADKCIHLWNTTNDVTVKTVDTGSQVCNLIWSKNVDEIVSTHGYSQFEVAVWKCPSMTRIAALTGHTHRVLYLTISPDGRKIATGSGDRTVRTWDVFPPAKAAVRNPAALRLSEIR